MSVGIDFEAHLGRIERKLNEYNAALTAPTTKVFGDSALAVAGTPTLLLIDAFSAPNRFWHVQTIGLFGSDGHTAVAGATADVYLGPGYDPSQTDFNAQILSGKSIPYIETHGKWDWTMSPRDRIYALVYGAAANQQLVLTARILEQTVEGNMATEL